MILRCLAILLMLMGCAAAAEAANDAADAGGEYAVLSGYGITHRGFGATKTQVQTADVIARAGFFLSDEVGKGHWWQGRHELFTEIPFHLVVDPQVRGMTGGYLLGSWKFTSFDSFAPYVFAGGGVVYTDLKLPTMGTRLDFSFQGGTGLQWFVANKTALSLEYRYHHISNAGTATPNEPLNSSKILLGVVWFR